MSLRQKKQFNLLFIFTDEQAAKTMAAYGNNMIETPNMDKLATESVVFKNAYASQSVCTPSRSTIMTGLYPHTTGCTENNIPLRPNIFCFPELGDFADYKIAYYGKWHLGDEIFAQHGFQDWRSIEDIYRKYYTEGKDRMQHSTYFDFLVKNSFKPDVILEDGFRMFSREVCARLPERYSKAAYLAHEASHFIRENRNHPFILYINTLEPHMPYFSSRDGQYHPKSIPLPENFYEPTKKQLLRTRLLSRAYYGQGALSTGPLKTEDDWRRVIAKYWALVSLVDTHLGRILDTLNECGLTDNTIIVYTSDHGDMMGSHKLLAKSTMFEEALKIPLLLKAPGLGSKCVNNPVSQVDLVPTLLDVMSQRISGHLQGFSWLPFLQEEKTLVEENVFIEWTRCANGFWDILGGAPMPDYWKKMASENEIRKALSDPVRSIVTPDRWKYNFSSRGEDELYNLKEDPYEMKNLVRETKYTSLIKELREKITQWQKRTCDTIKR